MLRAGLSGRGPRACGPLCRPEVGVPSRVRGLSRSAKDSSFGGEGVEFPVQLLLFRLQAVRVQRALEAVWITLCVRETADPDRSQRGLDIEQALPDRGFPLGDHAQPGVDGRLNVIRTGVNRILAGIRVRKVRAGDRRVAEGVRLEGSRRPVRRWSARAGEIGVGEARRRAVALPARRDAGAVSPRGLRERRLILLNRRRGSGAPGRRDQEPEGEGRGRNRGGPLRR